jgi:putative ABC transport system permease protein
MTRRYSAGSMAWRSLRHYALSTVVTGLSVALATGLVMAVIELSGQSRRAFTGGNLGFDAVLGARGSQLQLVLNAVFHLEASPGNIPWSLYKAVAAEPGVERAIPYAVGDNFEGYRIVGTTPELFTRPKPRRGAALIVASGGRLFTPGAREAVVGRVVADRTGLRVGSTFRPYHGLVYAEANRHDEVFTVAGVLEPTNSPADRVVWIPIEGVYRMGGHVLRGTGEVFVPKASEPIPEEHREVSAVMLSLSDPEAGYALDQLINRQGQIATLAWPIGRVMAELFDRVAWVNRVLTFVANIVLVVAVGSILASLYNTLNDRRREFAILRALGAHRSTVFSVIVLQAAGISGLGSAGGLAVYAVIMGSAASVVREQTGVVLTVWGLSPTLFVVPLAVTVLGGLSGLLPAWRAYRTDVADGLAPMS